MQANISDKTIFTIVIQENQILIALSREDRKKDKFLQVSDTIFSALHGVFCTVCKKSQIGTRALLQTTDLVWTIIQLPFSPGSIRLNSPDCPTVKTDVADVYS